MALAEHNNEGASIYNWSYTAYIILPQFDDEQCYTYIDTNDYTVQEFIKGCIDSQTPDRRIVLYNGHD